MTVSGAATASVETPPTTLSVQPENIPAELKALRRWLIWKWELRDGKWTKPPYNAQVPDVRVDVTLPGSWRTFEQAMAAYEDGKCDGIGLALGTCDDGRTLFGVDDDDGTLFDDIKALNTYMERSPRDRGTHGIGWASKPPDTRSRKGKHEIYDHGRYLAFTGQHVPGTPTEVRECSAALAALCARLFTQEAPPTPPQSAGTSTLTDDLLIDKASRSKQGEKFVRLFRGIHSDYPSQSEADIAFCSMLAFWSNRDVQQMDRIVRQSKLMRPKWDERRGAQTYGEITIANAIAACKTTYQSEGAPLVIRKASDVPDEKREKRYGGRLIRGLFGFLAGPGDGGKGMTMAYIASRFSTGDPFPGETGRRPPTNVIICAVEDSESAIKSRLRCAGANLDLIHFVSGPEQTYGGLSVPSPVRFDDDAGKLVKEAKNLHATVILMETIVEHFGDRAGKSSRRTTHNEADVRAALAPFRVVCQAGNLYGLAALHPRKSTEGGVDDSISGSAAFRNVTRLVHHVYRDPADDSDNPGRLFFTSKGNYLKRSPQTLRFRIESWDEDLGIPCSCVEQDCGHEGRVVFENNPFDDRSANDIWQEVIESKKQRKDLNVEQAEDFLHGLMRDGLIDMTPKEIFKRASDEGLSKASVERAKSKLHLVPKKEGFPAAVVGWKVSEI